MEASITLRLYAELNDRLPENRRGGASRVPCREAPTVGDAIALLGIDLAEVDLVLANGTSVGFSHVPEDGDRIAVYPVFESFNIRSAARLRPAPLRRTRFAAGPGLSAVVRLLRALGYDVLRHPGPDRRGLIDISNRDRRIILSRSARLLGDAGVARGILVGRAPAADEVRRILGRLDIWDLARPFSRCLRCNGILGNAVETAKGARPASGPAGGLGRCGSCGAPAGAVPGRLRRAVAAVLGAAPAG